MKNVTRILIIDDSPIESNLLKYHITQNTGYEFVISDSGEDALSVLEDPDRKIPDLVLLDVVMPGMDGYDVARLLKANERTKDIPIIFITSLDDVESKVKAFEQGGVDYICKPFNRDELLARISAHIRLKTMGDELRIKNNKLDTLNGQLEHRTEELEQLKEVLLREVHHRVKNNMQVISSLLNMQSRYLTDTKAIDIFRASMDRIRSMSLIHNHLYQSENLSCIDVCGYLCDLSRNLLNAYSVCNRIQLNIDMDPLTLSIDTVLPLGLLVNEILTNSLEHAFSGERTGKIDICLKDEGIQLILTLSDDGIGLPPDLEPTNAESMGMQLIMTLVEQLDGTMELNRDRGTEFRIVFAGV